MTKNKEKQTKQIEEAQNAVAEIAKIAGKGIGEIWKVFVRKTIVQGLSVLFAAICLIAAAVIIATGVTITLPMAIILIIAMVLIMVAINLLGNPQYFAMEDSIEVIKNTVGKHNGNSN